MRVTERSNFETVQANSAAARERQVKAGEVVATGLKLERPWDGTGAGRVALERVSSVQAAAIALAAESAGAELQATDRALEATVEALTDALELAVQMANASYNASDRTRTAAAVRSLKQSVISSLNIEVAGRFTLGGTLDQSQPFDASGAYVGDAGVRQIETGPGVLTDASLRADRFIAGVGGGIDVLAALERFATALEANDIVGVGASIDEMQSSITQVALGRTELGAMGLSAEAVSITSRTLELSAIERKVALTEADFIESATELALAERALEANIAVTSKSFKFTLLDRL